MAYTNIDDPSAYFQAETYTGNSTSPRTVTLSGNSDMQPDLTWIKTRSGPYYHYLFDSSRYSGSSYYRLVPSENFTEHTDTISKLTAFNTDGFTLEGSGSMANVNWSTQNYVAWNWKANGGTTSSNTDGNITSTVQSNQNAGFSIVTYTGTGSAATVGHGLGVTPDMIIFKNRSGSNVWATYHQGLGNNLKLELNGTGAQDADGAFMNGTLPTSSVFSVGASANTNTGSSNYVAYCFAEKQGYSKFGKYVGNGRTDGTFVYTGFKPAFVMMKNYSVGASWHMVDNKRLDYNPTTKVLYANLNNAEGTSDRVDLLSNGFKLRTTNTEVNGSGYNIIYMAFAENPFVTSTSIPTTAR